MFAPTTPRTLCYRLLRTNRIPAHRQLAYILLSDVFDSYIGQYA
jgi:hypothetical protein